MFGETIDSFLDFYYYALDFYLHCLEGKTFEFLHIMLFEQLDLDQWGIYIWSILTLQEYLEFNMSGNTGEHSVIDIITGIQYWIIHNITVLFLFITGWLSVHYRLVICQHGST